MEGYELPIHQCIYFRAIYVVRFVEVDPLVDRGDGTGQEDVVTLFALVSCILLSVSSLAWEYSNVGLNPISLWLFIFGIVWLFALWRGWDWFSSLGLFVAILAAAVGLWFEFNMEWMIAGAIFALFAWDMTEFRRRLRDIPADDEMRGVERRHIARISIFMLAGLFLITCALFTQMHFTFEWGVLLIVVILLGLAQLGAWFRRESKRGSI